jgi:hypothetical protein
MLRLPSTLTALGQWVDEAVAAYPIFVRPIVWPRVIDWKGHTMTFIARCTIASSAILSLAVLMTTRPTEAAATQFSLPQGLVCGLAHTGFPAAACENQVFQAGQGGSIPAGYTSVQTGDWGMATGQGFSHASVSVTSPALAGKSSDQLALPPGVVCGLKSDATPNERCMGFDAQVACPAGWVRRYAQDIGSCRPSGFSIHCNNWVWCEYTDPNAICSAPGASCINNIPQGTVCGLGHTPTAALGGQQPTVGFCMGLAIGASSNLQNTFCPAGFGLIGPRDEDAESGSGLLWCAKGGAGIVNTPAPIGTVTNSLPSSNPRVFVR